MIRQPFRRTFTSISRFQRPIPRGANSHFADGQPFQLQRVRFQRPPFFSWRRFTSILVYGLPVYFFFKYGPIGIRLNLDDDEGAEAVGPQGMGVPSEGEEFEGDEDAFFIPFTWPKEQPREFYKGSDPEWKEFIKLAKNIKKHKDIHTRLVSQIRSEVSSHPQAPRIMGKIDSAKGRYWLDLTFPSGPPKTHEVTGIEIGDEYVAWVTKEVDQEEFAKLKQTILPTAAFWGSYESAKYMVKLGYYRTKQYFGFLEPEDKRRQILKSQLREWERRHLRDVERSKEVAGKGAKAEEGTRSTEPAGDMSAPTVQGLAADLAAVKAAVDGNQTPASTSSPPTKTPQSSRKDPNIQSAVPISPSGGSLASLVFLGAMRKNLAPASVEPPRGCAVVSGLVEVLGDRGRAIVDVTAAYDPKRDEFVVSGWQPRSIQPRQQRPRGGN